MSELHAQHDYLRSLARDVRDARSPLALWVVQRRWRAGLKVSTLGDERRGDGQRFGLWRLVREHLLERLTRRWS